jgi:hypothetical protein
VDLVEVDVVGAKAGQRRVDLFEDRLAGQALAAGTVVHPGVHLGRQDDVLTAGVPRDRPADQFLRGAVLVDVGGIPEGDTQLDGLTEERLRILRIQGPQVRAGARGVAVAHTAQRDPADPQPRPAQSYVLHPSRSRQHGRWPSIGGNDRDRAVAGQAPDLPRASRLLPTSSCSPGTGLTHRPSWYRHRQA